ncbi:hypothetical protein SRHO_G00238290 [Serrasalmus rhombeus]
MLQLIFVLSTLISVTGLVVLPASCILYCNPFSTLSEPDFVSYGLAKEVLEDPVEAPVLTHQLNNDTCNITLTCRGHDLSINFSHYKETFEEKEVTSPGGVTLSLSVNGSTIICNHSDTVSWKTDVLEMRELKRLCADEGSVSPFAGVSVCLLKTVLYSITLTLMLSAVITVHIRERLTKSS